MILRMDHCVDEELAGWPHAESGSWSRWRPVLSGVSGEAECSSSLLKDVEDGQWDLGHPEQVC